MSQIGVQTEGSSERVKARHCGLDYLRGMAALMVAVDHAWYLENTTSAAHNMLTSLVFSIVSVAVPLFLLMSGAFLIRNGRNENAGRFWWHSIKKLGPLSIAFLLLAFFWQTSLWDEYAMGKYGTQELLYRTLHWYGGGAVVPLWYICMLPGLYFFVPFLARLWKKWTFNYFVVISFLLYGVGIVLPASGFSLPQPFAAVFFLGYFMLGAVIMELADKKKLPGIWVCLTLLILVILACTCWTYFSLMQSSENEKVHDMVASYVSPFTWFACLIWFALFSQLNAAPQKWVSLLSQLSFLIYLTHVPCQRIIRALLFHAGYIDQLHATWLNNVLFAISSVVLSIAVSFVIHKIYSPMENWLKSR